MKRIGKLAVVLLMAFAAKGVAQTTVPDIERWRGGFRQAESKDRISEEALHQVLDVEDFSMYKQAHNEHVASIPLWILAGIGAATSVACCGMGIYSKLTFTTDPHHPATPPAPIFFAIAGIAFGAALLPAIPAFVLTPRQPQEAGCRCRPVQSKTKTGVAEHGFYRQRNRNGVEFLKPIDNEEFICNNRLGAVPFDRGSPAFCDGKGSRDSVFKLGITIKNRST